MKKPLLEFTGKGIYCSAAKAYLDPWKPVDKAIISHGHADHSRWGHKSYITHHRNVPIILHRLGNISVTGKEWGETFSINNVKFSLHPAGHIIGSSQIRVEHKGEVWVFTGDYKTENDGISTPYEVVQCDTFITECTFGLPAFKWIPQKEVFRDINGWWAENRAEKRTSVLFGYSLGEGPTPTEIPRHRYWKNIYPWGHRKYDGSPPPLGRFSPYHAYNPRNQKRGTSRQHRTRPAQRPR